ncbi:MAG: methyltransferase domain-containing protein [Bacteroidetes bacterium]|nr:methyltransferase domain-containing protein [Bacteroidota bacterium]
MTPLTSFRNPDTTPLRVVLPLCLLLTAIGCTRTGVRGDSYVYGSRSQADTTGTGRIYFGREIGSVTAHAGGAEWMQQQDRDTAELPDRLVENLDLKQTDVVADIGAGTGYLTLRIAPVVPYGKVYAVDIQPEMLDSIRVAVDSLHLTNVQTVLGSDKSPNLPANSTNVALMVNSYHEFYYPWEMMHAIFGALKPGGRVVVIEYRGEDATIDLSPLHKLTEAQIRKEMEAIGFEYRNRRDILPRQHFVVFQKPFGSEVP